VPSGRGSSSAKPTPSARVRLAAAVTHQRDEPERRPWQRWGARLLAHGAFHSRSLTACCAVRLRPVCTAAPWEGRARLASPRLLQVSGVCRDIVWPDGVRWVRLCGLDQQDTESRSVSPGVNRAALSHAPHGRCRWAARCTVRSTQAGRRQEEAERARRSPGSRHENSQAAEPREQRQRGGR
jgi:hypothetical protein